MFYFIILIFVFVMMVGVNCEVLWSAAAAVVFKYFVEIKLTLTSLTV